MIRQLIILIIVSSGALYSQSNKYKWEELDYSPKTIARILGGESENNFIVFDDAGSFYKYQSGRWQTFSVPQKNKYIYYILNYVDPNTCLIIAVDEQWHSHFMILKNGVFKKYNLVHKNPFNHFRYVSDNNIYAAGAFGSLAKYDGNTFKIITTPIKSHIDAFYIEMENKYWLGTKSDGVFLFDGINFKKYECEDGINHEVQSFEKNGSTLKIITINHETLELKGKKFKHIETAKNGPLKYITKQPTGFLRIAKEPVSQDSFDIPLNLKPFSVQRMSNGTILFINQESKLFKSAVNKSNFFIDLSPYFNISSNITSKVEGMSFCDFSKDGFSDLLLSYQANPSTIYFGNKSNFFSQKIIYTDSSINRTNGYVHVIGDIDGDYIPDLIIAQHNRKRSIIEIFKGDGNDFKHFKSINIEDSIGERIVENLTLSDFDQDGDLDLILVYYLGKGSKKGSVMLFENRLWGTWWCKWNKQKEIFDGWNKQVLFADFNGDGFNDIYVINKWGNNKLLGFNNDNFIDLTNTSFSDTTKTISSSAISFDYDNDGDLDLLVSSDTPLLQLLENNGKGVFSDVSKKIVFPTGTKKYLLLGDSDLVIGDYNNDGFLDILALFKTSSSIEKYLFINEKGDFFIDKKKDFGLDKFSLQGAINGDIDDDGDLDIIGYDNSNIRLLINNLDDQNYLKIKLLASHSSPAAIGSKIFVYKHGHINDKRFLYGYRQIGSYEYSKNQNSELTVHFGLDASITYDIVTEFYAGNNVSILNVNTGQTLTIAEVSQFTSTFIELPGALFRFFYSRAIQFYILCVLFSLAVFLIGIKYGVRNLGWDVRTISLLATTNISAFWIILIVTSDSTHFIIKYVLPFIVMLIGTIIPLYISFFIRQKSNLTKDISILKEELLQLSINYSHGRWALTNINGIIMLIENMPKNEIQNEKVLLQLSNRLETFENLTKPNVVKLIKTAESIPTFLTESEEKLSKQIIESSNKIFFVKTKSAELFSDEMLNYFYLVKRLTANIKTRITSEFSCNPEQVINLVLELFLNELGKRKINVSKEKTYLDNFFALISKDSLGEIISNCISNSLYAIGETQGEINISLQRIDLKLLITISDSGGGISEEKWEKIFESGYTEKKSTGFGLYHAREILKKYGGRIYISESIPFIRTSINIELNEGIRNEANTITN